MPMVPQMRFRARRPALLGLVVAGLFLGLVGMHHLVEPAHPAQPAPGDHVAAVAVPDVTAPPAAPEQQEGGHAELLHLCLAVLAAGALIALGLLARRRRDIVPAAPVRGIGGTWSTSRAPPQPVPRRLALLCVLRT